MAPLQPAPGLHCAPATAVPGLSPALSIPPACPPTRRVLPLGATGSPGVSLTRSTSRGGVGWGGEGGWLFLLKNKQALSLGASSSGSTRRRRRRGALPRWSLLRDLQMGGGGSSGFRGEA